MKNKSTQFKTTKFKINPLNQRQITQHKRRKFVIKYRPNVSLVVITLLVYLFSKWALTAPYLLVATFFSLLFLACFAVYLKKNNFIWLKSKLFAYSIFISVLLLVASTGWFFSPFFYMLYLLILAIAVYQNPKTSVIFTLTIVGLFSFQIGEVNVVYDLLIIFTLLTILPLGFLIHSHYWKLKQASINEH